MHTYTDTCIHYIHTYIHTYMHGCMHAYIHTYVRTYVTYRHANTQINKPTYIHTDRQTY